MLQSSPSLTLCQCTTFRFSISLKTCLSRGSPLGRALNSGEQEKVTRLLKREMELHSVPQTIHLGWKVVGELYKGELAIEEHHQARILQTTAIVAAERQYMSYHFYLAKTLSFTKRESGRGKRGGSRGGSRGGGRDGRG